MEQLPAHALRLSPIDDHHLLAELYGKPESPGIHQPVDPILLSTFAGSRIPPRAAGPPGRALLADRLQNLIYHHVLGQRSHHVVLLVDDRLGHALNSATSSISARMKFEAMANR